MPSPRNAPRPSGAPANHCRDRFDLTCPSATDLYRPPAGRLHRRGTGRTLHSRHVDAQIKAAQEARAFAWRRLNALSDMAKVAAREEDPEAAIEGQLVALFREIGWIETGLAELGEGAQPLIERLRPVARAPACAGPSCT